MRAIVIEKHGPPTVLQVTEKPAPEVSAGEVRVRVHAVGLNHLDVWVRRGVPGHAFPLPLIPGSDVAGEVETVGPGVADVKKGDAVVVAAGVSCGHCLSCLSGADHRCRAYAILGENRDGGCAELVTVPRANVFAKPENLSFVQAVTLGVSMITAWEMLIGRAALRAGERVLVWGAGAGVGLAAVQIATLFGAEVIAVASSQAKLDLARNAGAKHAVLLGKQDVVAEVRALTQRAGADVVVEHVGAATWEQSLKVLARHGRLVTCGATTGNIVQVDLRHLFFKSQSLLGSTMGSKADFSRILALAARGQLTTPTAQVLPLENIAQAHVLLEDRNAVGKIVLQLT